MIERVTVLVDGGHGRARTAPVAYKRVAVRGHVRGRAWRGSADKGDAVVTPTASETEKSKPIHQIGSKKGV